jgi:hypothetical protein
LTGLFSVITYKHASREAEKDRQAKSTEAGQDRRHQREMAEYEASRETKVRVYPRVIEMINRHMVNLTRAVDSALSDHEPLVPWPTVEEMTSGGAELSVFGSDEVYEDFSKWLRAASGLSGVLNEVAAADEPLDATEIEAIRDGRAKLERLAIDLADRMRSDLGPSRETL